MRFANSTHCATSIIAAKTAASHSVAQTTEPKATSDILSVFGGGAAATHPMHTHTDRIVCATLAPHRAFRRLLSAVASTADTTLAIQREIGER
jgi:hypothetical protein